MGVGISPALLLCTVLQPSEPAVRVSVTDSCEEKTAKDGEEGGAVRLARDWARVRGASVPVVIGALLLRLPAASGGCSTAAAAALAARQFLEPHSLLSRGRGPGQGRQFRGGISPPPVGLRLRGGKNAFWGRSYPWEGVSHNQASRVPDFYAVLGVQEKADAAEIRSAYKKLCLTHHPDRRSWNPEQGEDPEGNAFVAIQDAWDVLGSEVHRTAYDEWLRRVRDPQALEEELAAQRQQQQKSDQDAGWSFGSKNRYGFFK